MRVAILTGLLFCSLAANVYLYARLQACETAAGGDGASLAALADELILERRRREQLAALAGFARIRNARWAETRRRIESELLEAAAAEPQDLQTVIRRLEELRDHDAQHQARIVEQLVTFMGGLTPSQRRRLAQALAGGRLDARLAGLR